MNKAFIKKKLSELISHYDALSGTAVTVNGYYFQFLGFYFLEFEPEWHTKPHHHAFFELHYVIDGNCMTASDEASYELSDGQFYFLAPGMTHSRYSPEGHEGFSIRWNFRPESDFASQVSDSLQPLHRYHCSVANCPFYPIHDKDFHYAERFIALMETALQAPVLVQQLAIAGWLLELQTTLEQQNRQEAKLAENFQILTHDEIVDHCIRFMEKNYQQPVSMPLIARSVHLSYGHVSRVFRNVTGMTMNEYLTMTRLKKAQYELRTSKASVRTIAAKSGFSHENYFSNLFKKRYGISPIAYRKSHTPLSD